MNDKERLEELLLTFDIPEKCKEINFRNINWMIRNLAFRNKENKNFKEAMDLVKKLYRSYYRRTLM